MFKNQRIAAAIAAAVVASFAADIASAACTRLAFSVNDYGKIGPTNDAKRLLDPYIKKWTADRGIKTYTVGPKDVTCELFLDVIVFDEYTCKASATVCWNGPLPKNHEVEAGATPPASVNKAASRPARTAPPKAAEGQAPAGQAPASTLPSAAPVATGSVRPAPAAATAAPKAAPAAAPAVAPTAAPAAPAAPKAAPAAPPAN